MAKMLVAMLFSLSLSTIQAAVTLTANPTEIDLSLVNATVTVTCTNDGSGSVKTVQNLIIEKQLYGDWGVVAQISAGDSNPSVSYPKATASGSVGGSGQTSKLQVQLTGGDAVGQYKCRANGLDSTGKFTADTATTDVSTLSNGGCCEALTDIEERLMTVEGKLTSGGGNANYNTSLVDGDALYRLLNWPKGRYTFLMTNTGCPHPGFTHVEWKDKGYRQFHTESTSPTNEDAVSPGSHLKQPIQGQNGNNHFMYFYFCTDLSDVEKGPAWPKGNYCIMKEYWVACPDGFHQGSVSWDEENTLHENKWLGDLPGAAFGADSLIYFCCRRDASPDQPIVLPIANPFYLFRFMGKCQQVAGTRVVNEYIVFDTENTGNIYDKFSDDYHPDGELQNVRLELCYYERSG